jgi:anthranilate synthase component 1
VIAESFEGFASAYNDGRPQILTVRLVDDLETPITAYLKLGHGKPYAFLYESVEGGAWRGRYSIITLAPDLVWRCLGERAESARGFDAVAADDYLPEPEPPLESLRALLDESRIEFPPALPPMAAGLFGVLGYDMVRLVEPLGPANPDPLGLPDAILVRPSIVAVFDSIGQEIILSTPVRPSDASATEAWDAARARLASVCEALKRPLPVAAPAEPRLQPAFAPAHTVASYGDIVARVKDYIAAGDIFQVVPSQRFEAPFDLDPFAFYRSLRRTNPSPFLFYLDFGPYQLAGSSPEILVRLRDGEITIRPIAGTRRRGATPDEDLALEQDLLADPKELAEHLMLLDLGRNDVGRVAAPASVRVTQSFAVERYSHVMHIVSNVVGRAPQDVDPVEVLLAALPAGTVSGAPKVRAMEIIDELETVKRGLGYAGAAGYISARGEIDTCIVLRAALFKDGRIYAQAGGGVVADSDATAEYEETLHKSGAARRAADEAWRFA